MGIGRIGLGRVGIGRAARAVAGGRRVAARDPSRTAGGASEPTPERGPWGTA